MPYMPEAGDLIWTDFDPRVGREKSGRRPALVVWLRIFIARANLPSFLR